MQWWALPTSPMRPSASSGAIQNSHSGRSRRSGSDSTASARSSSRSAAEWWMCSAGSKSSASIHSGALQAERVGRDPLAVARRAAEPARDVREQRRRSPAGGRARGREGRGPAHVHVGAGAFDGKERRVERREPLWGHRGSPPVVSVRSPLRSRGPSSAIDLARLRRAPVFTETFRCRPRRCRTRWRRPRSKPVLNQRVRCSAVPCVNVSGLIRPVVCSWMRSSPTEPAAVSPSSRSPCSSSPRSNVECAHTPARQSACSSVRTESALRWSGFSRGRVVDLLGDAGERLHVVAVLVRDHVRLGEVAGRLEALGELAEEAEVEVDLAVERAVERPGAGGAGAAAGRRASGGTARAASAGSRAPPSGSRRPRTSAGRGPRRS